MSDRPKSIRAVGFDLGETLIEYVGLPLSWHELYEPALTAVAGVCGRTLTAADIDRGKAILRRYNTRLTPRVDEVRSETILREILAEWGVDDPPSIESVEDAFFGFFQQTVAVFPEAEQVLRELRERGIKVGLLSDLPYGMPRRLVERDFLPIASLLDCALTSVDVGRRKPNPVGYLALAEQLGVAPVEMWYVGNERKDIEGANAAWMTSVLIDRVGEGVDYGQRHTISSLTQLLRLIGVTM